jgi:hypothetical protein
MAYEISMSQDWTRQVQTSEEVTKGVAVLNSTYKNIGIGSKLTEGISMTHEETPLLGTPDIYDDANLEEHNTINLTWALIDTRFLRYCTENVGGTGTIEKTNTIIRTQKIDGVANTKIYYGCMCDSLTLNLDKFITANAVLKVMSTSNWLTQAATDTAIGATTTYAPALTSVPWTHKMSGLAAGTSPMTYGGSARDIAKGTLTMARNVYEQMPLNNATPKTMRPGGRRISFTFDTWVKDSAILGDVKGMTAKAITVQLFSTPVVLTLANVKFNSYSSDDDAGSNEAKMETIAGTAQTATVTALTVTG